MLMPGSEIREHAMCKAEDLVAHGCLSPRPVLFRAVQPGSCPKLRHGPPEQGTVIPLGNALFCEVQISRFSGGRLSTRRLHSRRKCKTYNRDLQWISNCPPDQIVMSKGCPNRRIYMHSLEQTGFVPTRAIIDTGSN